MIYHLNQRQEHYVRINLKKDKHCELAGLASNLL